MIDLFDQTLHQNLHFVKLNSRLIFTALNRKTFYFLVSGRRRVSLRRNPQLNHCPTSASSHYFSICKLNLAIPVILLLLLSTTFDVTGKWFNNNSNIASKALISLRRVVSDILPLVAPATSKQYSTSFIKHFDHISMLLLFVDVENSLLSFIKSSK